MTKISQLGAAAGLIGTEVLPIVQSGETKKVSVNEIFAFVEDEADRATTEADKAAEKALLSQAWAESPTAPEGVGTKSAKTHAADAAADRALSQTARIGAEAANDASALNKTGAETAQSGAQTAATTATGARDTTITARDVTLLARDTVLAWSYSLNEIQLENFQQGDGSIQIGVGAFVPAGSGGLGTVIGRDAGKNTGADAQKGSILGGGAFENGRGYAPALVGVYCGKDSGIDYPSAVGTHVFQSFNQSGKEVRGFGIPASGTVTFTGAGTDTKGFTLGGVAFTGVTGTPGANQYQIGATAADTARNAHRAYMDARASNVTLQDVIVRRSGAVLTIVSLAFGTIGNGFTLATDDAQIALSGASLSGGAAAINGTLLTGAVGMGFGAGQDGQPIKQRPSWNIATFSGLPVAGDQFTIGSIPVVFTWVAGAPVGANEVGIYGDLATTMFELAERLATHPSTSVDDAWYYPLPNGLYAVHRTNGGNIFRFDFRRTTNATTAFGRFLRGGSSEAGRDVVLKGFSAGAAAVVSRATVDGSSSGFGSVIFRSTISGSTSGGNCYIENTHLIGQDNGQNANLFGSFALGNNNFIAGTDTPYIALTSIASDGTITLATPHGLVPGPVYQMQQRNLVSGTDLIKRSLGGAGTPTNLGTALGSFQCVVLGPRTLQIYQFKNDPGALDTFSVSGTVGNIEVRTRRATWSGAYVIGDSVAAKNHAVTVCGPDQLRFHSDASEGNFLAAPLLLNSYTFTNAHRMQCAFSNNPANGDTITIFGQVLTFRTTATLITEVQIGANARATVDNLVARVISLAANPTYQATFSRIIPYTTASLAPAANFAILLCDTGTDMTMTVSSSVGTVTTLVALAVGNIPAASSFPADMDGCIFRTTNNPRRGGQPGLARLNRTAGRVEFLA